MGNQLFQLAAAYSLSKKIGNNTQILPDERSGSFTVEQYFQTNINYPLSWKVIHYLIQLIPKRLKHRGSKVIMDIYYSLFRLRTYSPSDPMKIDQKFSLLEDNICLDGYFQSELYFKNVANETKEQFKFRVNYLNTWKKWYATLPNHQKLIAVHIRLGDYRSQAGWGLGGEDLTLPAQYYIQLIEANRGAGNLFIIMSDEPETVKSWLPQSDSILFSGEEAIIDLITLTQSHICILSHSSFSWWGAWLNKKENARIYVPKYFLGFKVNRMVPENIIPENWIPIEVTNDH